MIPCQEIASLCSNADIFSKFFFLWDLYDRSMRFVHPASLLKTLLKMLFFQYFYYKYPILLLQISRSGRFRGTLSLTFYGKNVFLEFLWKKCI